MIHLQLALAAEAKPLRLFWKMRQLASTPFVVYQCERPWPIRLIISGSGKTAAAAAAGYLQGMHPAEHAWINCGVAGSTHWPLGEAVLANMITDDASGQRWFPYMGGKQVQASGSLVTVDRPQTTMRDKFCYDMESSGFMTAVCRFTSVELIRVVKIISDNHEQQANALTAADISDLMAPVPALLQDHIEQLHHILNMETEHPELENSFTKALAQFHFSHS